jgi:hypothetical protein
MPSLRLVGKGGGDTIKAVLTDVILGVVSSVVRR